MRFIVRVELHNADEDGHDNENFREAMHERLFARTVTSNLAGTAYGKTYHLPDATYFYQTDAPDVDTQAVLNLVRQALAVAVSKKLNPFQVLTAGILVTDVHNLIMWQGLTEVPPTTT